MGIREDLLAESAAHDPYGFKAKGENGVKTLHANDPYTYHEFPKVLYKAELTALVYDKEGLDNAISDGWSETKA